jgi:hypothetical protein
MDKETTQPFPYRPLGLVKTLLEGVGLEITYAYEDLIFLQHNPVLLQFGKVGNILFFYRNVQTPEEEASRLLQTIQTAATQQGFVLIDRGRYRVSEAADQSLSLEFLPEADDK